MITFSELGYWGQLGNQLFQYAMLRGVGAATGFQVKIPKRFDNFGKAKGLVELEPFQPECCELRPDDMPNVKYRYIEPSPQFSEAVFSVPDGTDFRGFFQSFRYWQGIEAQLRSELRFPADIEQAAESFLTNVRQGERPVVSLHVRRGDYLDSAANGYHSMPSRSYYDAAIDHFPLATILVFSDDIPWCRNEFKDERFQFCNSGNHWRDLAIMSLCDHHIICASSFSWWGAWLNATSAKTVITPQRWFGDRCTHFTVDDLLPATWIRI